MPRLDLSALRKSYEESTQGTWVAFTDDSGRGHTNVVTAGLLRDMKVILSLPGRDKHEPDIELICAAHNSFPQLLAIAQAAEPLFIVLRNIINDLPSKRDWLDPDLEKMAKDVLAGTGGRAMNNAIADIKDWVFSLGIVVSILTIGCALLEYRVNKLQARVEELEGRK